MFDRVIEIEILKNFEFKRLTGALCLHSWDLLGFFRVFWDCCGFDEEISGDFN